MHELSRDSYKELKKIAKQPIEYPKKGLEHLSDTHKTLLKFDYIELSNEITFKISDSGKAYIYLRKRGLLLDTVSVIMSFAAFIVSLFALFKP